MRGRASLVAVVGRPNVGKSTLFNRIVGRAVAVVDDVPGVTRDRREADAAWTNVKFRLVDTGGLVPGTQDAMEAAILGQVEFALADADVVLFVVDAREGLSAVDREIADSLRAHADRVVLVANKVESDNLEAAAMEAAELGFGPPYAVSAEHGRGVGDLLDEVVKRVPRRVEAQNGADAICFTLVGRPNVGKSSLANRLLGEPRLIVHPEAGTTRDAVDVPFRFDGSDFVLVDTAGLRRRSHVARGVEFYSTLRTRRSLERSDVGILVLDATQPITNQDSRIAGLITEAGKSILFLFNKWDLVDKKTGTSEAYSRKLRDAFPLLNTSPVLFVSAETGIRVSRIPGIVRELYNERRLVVPTTRLNDILHAATEQLQPPVPKNGRALKFFYITQTADSPPTFAVFTSNPRSVSASYRSYLRNTFRERLGIRSAPIRLVFRSRRKT